MARGVFYTFVSMMTDLGRKHIAQKGGEKGDNVEGAGIGNYDSGCYSN